MLGVTCVVSFSALTSEEVDINVLWVLCVDFG